AHAADRADHRARLLPRAGARRHQPVGRGHAERGGPRRPGRRNPVSEHSALTPLAQGMLSAPPIDYAAIAPLLIVLGAACVAVLVEAFLPRHQRWPAQVALSIVALGGAGLALGLYAGSSGPE